MENKARDNAVIAAYNYLAMIDEWHMKAKVWLSSDIFERESLPDPETVKPIPLDCRQPTSEQYRILLSTGSPAIRIVGVLDDDCAPVTAELQYHFGLFNLDWHTAPVDTGATETLLAYANSFHWG